MRIVIANEHPIFRDGLRLLLETEPGLLIVGDIGHHSEALTVLRDLNPDILLLSFTQGGRPPLETLQEIAESGSPVRTIVLTPSVDSPDVLRALELGARGVVPHDSGAEALFESIHTVMEGRYWIGRKGASNDASSLRDLETSRRRTKAFGLTRRELEIVRTVVAGDTNKEIAARFEISENTVKRHLTHIFNKLGASNRVELALFAAHHRLLQGI